MTKLRKRGQVTFGHITGADLFQHSGSLTRSSKEKKQINHLISGDAADVHSHKAHVSLSFSRKQNQSQHHSHQVSQLHQLKPNEQERESSSSHSFEAISNPDDSKSPIPAPQTGGLLLPNDSGQCGPTLSGVSRSKTSIKARKTKRFGPGLVNCVSTNSHKKACMHSSVSMDVFVYAHILRHR
ncbi:unnamed protein product [Protopolystoma xenopodis]|uniref:Uncharacterized protein n=1 Tax=Protopolystoma xenopodis TaxID=117903 RepID=A0A3S5APE4_9PLAT|nr:unnamed protein product [Protopolystoma xenopodis]